MRLSKMTAMDLPSRTPPPKKAMLSACVRSLVCTLRKAPSKKYSCMQRYYGYSEARGGPGLSQHYHSKVSLHTLSGDCTSDHSRMCCLSACSSATTRKCILTEVFCERE